MGKPKDPFRHKRGKGLLPLTRGEEEMARVRPHRPVEFQPKNTAQARYAELIDSQELIFAIGPAGVGKTYVAGTKAAELFLAGRYERILITRPICEAGEELGFLPGTVEEKSLPYFRPMLEVLERRMGKSHVELLIKSKKIEFFPLAYMRGGSFDRTLMILDEAQNTTPAQMKLFLTRMGEDSTMIIDGDATQLDLPKGQPSGLPDGIRKARGLAGVAIQQFTSADIVRSGLVQRLVERYETTDEDFRREMEAALDEDPHAGLQRALAL